MIKKSITVTEQQEDWIQAQIASGHLKPAASQI